MDRAELTSGVSAMSLYVPRLRVPLEAWCEWTGNAWDKISAVVGRSFRVPGRHENVYTMAANAVLRLIRQNDVDPARIGFLGSRHRVEHRQRGRRGDRARHGRSRARSARPAAPVAPPRGARVQARLPGRRVRAEERAALRCTATAATGWPSSCARTSPNTSAARPASRPRARAPWRCWSSASRACSRSTSRTPAARRTTAGPTSASRSRATSPRATRRARSGWPISRCSAASTRRSRTSTRPCTPSRTCCGGSASRPARTTRTCAALFFHRPYHLMPVQAMSFLYVRGLARGDHRANELEKLCAEAGVSIERRAARDGVLARSLREHARGRRHGRSVRGDQRRRRRACARQPTFRELLAQKMSLGSEAVKDLGNLYSAALPAWIAAGLEEAATRRHRALRRAAGRRRLRQRRRRRSDARAAFDRAGRRPRAASASARARRAPSTSRASNTKRCTTAATFPASLTRRKTSSASRASARATTRPSRISASSTTSTSPDSTLGGSNDAEGSLSGRGGLVRLRRLGWRGSARRRSAAAGNEAADGGERAHDAAGQVRRGSGRRDGRRCHRGLGWRRRCGRGCRRSDGDRRRHDGWRRRNRCWWCFRSLERWAETAAPEVGHSRGPNGCRRRCRHLLGLRDGSGKRRHLGRFGWRRSELLREACVRHRDADFLGNERNDDEDVRQGRNTEAHGWGPTPAHEVSEKLSERLHFLDPRGFYAPVWGLSRVVEMGRQ